VLGRVGASFCVNSPKPLSQRDSGFVSSCRDEHRAETRFTFGRKAKRTAMIDNNEIFIILLIILLISNNCEGGDFDDCAERINNIVILLLLFNVIKGRRGNGDRECGCGDDGCPHGFHSRT